MGAHVPQQRQGRLWSQRRAAGALRGAAEMRTQRRVGRQRQLGAIQGHQAQAGIANAGPCPRARAPLIDLGGQAQALIDAELASRLAERRGGGLTRG